MWCKISTFTSVVILSIICISVQGERPQFWKNNDACNADYVIRADFHNELSPEIRYNISTEPVEKRGYNVTVTNVYKAIKNAAPLMIPDTTIVLYRYLDLSKVGSCGFSPSPGDNLVFLGTTVKKYDPSTMKVLHQPVFYACALSVYFWDLLSEESQEGFRAQYYRNCEKDPDRFFLLQNGQDYTKLE